MASSAAHPSPGSARTPTGIPAATATAAGNRASIISPRPNGPSLPELDRSEYLSSVLELPAEESESSVEEALLAKATSLGISTRRPLSLNADDTTSSTTSGSASTPARFHSRTFSIVTDDTEHSLIEGLALSSWETDSEQGSHSSLGGSPRPDGGAVTIRLRPKPLSFSLYERYLGQIDQNAIGQQKFIRGQQSDAAGLTLLGIDPKRSYANLKRNLKARLRSGRRFMVSLSSAEPAAVNQTCVCCREEFDRSNSMQNLPCGHSYCNDCLRVMIDQAITEESRMPPRCCTQPIPGDMIRRLLTVREEQNAFLRKVVEFSVPCESRVFCTNRQCGEFIPPHHHPKHPFVAVCTRCRTHVCTMCRRDAHGIGNDCPQDKELEAVLRLGESSGWRRCYKCKSLVELAYGCTHMTCRCSAQFCYICGAVWNRQVGCPNLCNGEEELERRRESEEARAAQREVDNAARQAEAAEEARQRAAAEGRTRDCAKCQAQLWRMNAEMERYRTYVRKSRWLMWARHSQERLDQGEKGAEQVERTRERHSKTALHLEDRQVGEEMEMRDGQVDEEKAVMVRLKHIEGYCSGAGPPGGLVLNSPRRKVNERDLMELGQQYRLRIIVQRQHQSRINVLRDKQAGCMEKLLERQEDELARLEERLDDDMDHLGARFAEEEDEFAAWFSERAATLRGQWAVQCAILKQEKEEQTGQEFAPLEIPWLSVDDDLDMIEEEGPTQQQKQEQQQQQQQQKQEQQQ